MQRHDIFLVHGIIKNTMKMDFMREKKMKRLEWNFIQIDWKMHSSEQIISDQKFLPGKMQSPID